MKISVLVLSLLAASVVGKETAKSKKGRKDDGPEKGACYYTYIRPSLVMSVNSEIDPEGGWGDYRNPQY